ncbi:hypothetical protein Tsubulata_008567 [Turnera subulata]|uniref:Peptidase A1 domain-containing protein n=1 Tax=Turnera subulata TaxID=218843 RepID=A0A9Q0G093_9ROSI|nr:hypothetical protein Tsubulata_008567 [Turnera subulata]
MLRRNRLVVLAWSVCFLFINGSAVPAVTFSSKLIHRFSDEAKSLRISDAAVGDDQRWPKRNTFDYMRLLLDNDLKRQRMKLGSKTQPLFPAQGSRTLFFGNELSWLHYTWIDIGTPNASFLVALDAGSDYFWLPCAPVLFGAPIMQDRDLSEYNPSLSSSSKQLSCSHQLCELGSNCKHLDDPCPYIAKYNDLDNTSSSGFLVEDHLHLASLGQRGSRKSVQASVIIGCGRKQSGSYLDGAAPDGLMGLGPGNISVPRLLAKAGLIRDSFSICFDEDSSGRILFGDQGHASQQSSPLLPIDGDYVGYFVGVETFCVGNSCPKQSGFRALVDSGSSFTFLPTDVYDKIVSEFDKQVTAERISSQGSPWDYCYNASSQELRSMPAMRLKFRMNQSFVIHNPTYSVPQDKEYTLFCLTVQPTDANYGIIGQNFMTGYRLVFDMENLILGWSTSNCQDMDDSTEVHLAPPPSDKSANPLPTNEQQSIPNAHAVSPAVAGRTSSKSSSAFQHVPSLLNLISSLLLLLLLCLFLLAT